MSLKNNIKKFIEIPEKKDFLIVIIESIPFILKELILTGKTDLKIVWDESKKVKQVS